MKRVLCLGAGPESGTWEVLDIGDGVVSRVARGGYNAEAAVGPKWSRKQTVHLLSEVFCLDAIVSPEDLQDYNDVNLLNLLREGATLLRQAADVDRLPTFMKERVEAFLGTCAALRD